MGIKDQFQDKAERMQQQGKQRAEQGKQRAEQGKQRADQAKDQMHNRDRRHEDKMDPSSRRRDGEERFEESYDA
ncbi:MULTISPECIES: hypothetical protein [Streptomyces]|jgi:hypothetical protein|uniref:Uncharacterized protein n=1 Tax=Streptomyces flaveolus TaxID=67297 RepID=A0ABV1VCF1_9ACTN|nr:hypothetical protein [Streptomyces sp. SCL15-6]